MLQIIVQRQERIIGKKPPNQEPFCHSAGNFDLNKVMNRMRDNQSPTATQTTNRDPILLDIHCLLNDLCCINGQLVPFLSETSPQSHSCHVPHIGWHLGPQIPSTYVSCHSSGLLSFSWTVQLLHVWREEHISI